MQDLKFQLLLKSLADGPNGHRNGFTFYGPGVTLEETITYHDLYQRSVQNAVLLRRLPGWESRSVVLLMFSTDREELIWFWSALMADLVPVSLPIRTGGVFERLQTWVHLKNLLEEPLVLSNLSSSELEMLKSSQVFSTAILSLLPVQSLTERRQVSYVLPDEVAYLGLSSGSTASAKAIPVFHSRASQNASIRAKLMHFNEQSVILDSAFGDHFTTSFCSSILPGLIVGGSVVIVYSGDIYTHPLNVLRCMTKHAVSHRFETNSRLVQTIRAMSTLSLEAGKAGVDLSNFKTMVTSGERVQTRRCIEFNRLAHALGAAPRTVVPCFGMSEMQGGFIASLEFPVHDLYSKDPFACTGRPMPGLEVRIVNEEGNEVGPTEIGWMEIKSSTMFSGYLGDKAQPCVGFLPDGWFKTLDFASIDEQGVVSVRGRSGEAINCLADLFFPLELETLLKDANLRDVDVSTVTVIKHYDEVVGTDVAVILFCTLNDELFDQQVKQMTDILLPVIKMEVYDILSVDPETVKRTARGKVNRRNLSLLYSQRELQFNHSKRERERYRRPGYESSDGYAPRSQL